MQPGSPYPPEPGREAPAAAPARPASWRVLGFALMVPAVAAAVFTFVVPDIQTVARSFQAQQATLPGTGSGFGGTRPAGTGSYSLLLGHPLFWNVLAFSLSLAVIPLVVALLVAPLLAAALHAGGTWARRAGLLMLSVPVVAFSPLAIAAAWGAGGAPWPVPSRHWLTHNTAWDLRYVTGLGSFGAVCGVALLVFLAVLRARGQAATRRTFTAVTAVAGLAVVAASLQTFTIPATLAPYTTGTPPKDQLFLPAQTMFSDFANLNFTSPRDAGANAAAVTVVGIGLGLLGLIAGGICIGTRLTISLGTPASAAGSGWHARPASPQPSRGAATRAVLALAAVAAVTVITMLPWLAARLSGPSGEQAQGPLNLLAGLPGLTSVAGAPPPPPPLPALQNDAYTWLPPLIGAVIAVGAAFLAALGIGGLRPLGSRSRWLLIGFCPWLFAGTLSLASAADGRTATSFPMAWADKVLGDNSIIVLIPPVLLSVPALVVLTLFCYGRSGQWHAQLATGARPAASFWRAVAAPALPLAILLAGATAAMNAQSGVALTPEAPAGASLTSGLATPLPLLIVAFAAVAVMQVTYLDKIVIQAEPADSGALPPATAWTAVASG